MTKHLIWALTLICCTAIVCASHDHEVARQLDIASHMLEVKPPQPPLLRRKRWRPPLKSFDLPTTGSEDEE